MTDTSPEITRIQFEIFTKKPLKERLEIWGAMMDMMRQNQINRIKKRLGNDLTEAQIKFEIIKENYGEELGAERLNELKIAIIGKKIII
jgi:hypothetical protein